MGADVVSPFTETHEALHIALSSAWQTLSRFRVAASRRSDLFAYFEALDEVLINLNDAGSVDLAGAIMSHVDYLADKAGCPSAVVLGGGGFIADLQIILDALTNVSAILQAEALKRPEQPPEGIPSDVFTLILKAEKQLAGWCTREKALLIARTVLQERPEVCVEIGIFGGRSLVPCAAALRHIGVGAIYGIEAWSSNVATENATNEVNDRWWSNVDFVRIKQDFYGFVCATNLTQHVRLVESPSGRAAGLFDQIDFLHIDGSHSLVNAAEDVILYARKVRSGGIVVFDDVNWQSTAPARELLAALCSTVTVLKDPDTGLDVCAVLRRR